MTVRTVIEYYNSVGKLSASVAIQGASSSDSSTRSPLSRRPVSAHPSLARPSVHTDDSVAIGDGIHPFVASLVTTRGPTVYTGGSTPMGTPRLPGSGMSTPTRREGGDDGGILSSRMRSVMRGGDAPPTVPRSHRPPLSQRITETASVPTSISYPRPPDKPASKLNLYLNAFHYKRKLVQHRPAVPSSGQDVPPATVLKHSVAFDVPVVADVRESTPHHSNVSTPMSVQSSSEVESVREHDAAFDAKPLSDVDAALRMQDIIAGATCIVCRCNRLSIIADVHIRCSGDPAVNQDEIGLLREMMARSAAVSPTRAGLGVRRVSAVFGTGGEGVNSSPRCL